MTRFLISVFMSLLPSAFRIPVLRMMGATIGRGCHIGPLTILDARQIELGDNVRIAAFNLIHRLAKLEMVQDRG